MPDLQAESALPCKSTQIEIAHQTAQPAGAIWQRGAVLTSGLLRKASWSALNLR